MPETTSAADIGESAEEVAPLPSCFIESALPSKAEYEASLLLPPAERAAAERAAAARAEKATTARPIDIEGTPTAAKEAAATKAAVEKLASLPDLAPGLVAQLACLQLLHERIAAVRRVRARSAVEPGGRGVGRSPRLRHRQNDHETMAR